MNQPMPPADTWPASAVPDPRTLSDRDIILWAETAESRRALELGRARQSRNYRRWLEEEYQRRHGKPIPTWEGERE